jgi:hypothetical protein
MATASRPELLDGPSDPWAPARAELDPKLVHVKCFFCTMTRASCHPWLPAPALLAFKQKDVCVVCFCIKDNSFSAWSMQKLKAQFTTTEALSMKWGDLHSHYVDSKRSGKRCTTNLTISVDYFEAAKKTVQHAQYWTCPYEDYPAAHGGRTAEEDNREITWEEDDGIKRKVVKIYTHRKGWKLHADMSETGIKRKQQMDGCDADDQARKQVVQDAFKEMRSSGCALEKGRQAVSPCKSLSGAGKAAGSNQTLAIKRMRRRTSNM